MDETRQMIATLLVSDDPADHARARELHARLRQAECSYLSPASGEIGGVIYLEPDDLSVRQIVGMSLWTLCCFAGVGLVGWALGLGIVALFDLLGIL